MDRENPGDGFATGDPITLCLALTRATGCVCAATNPQSLPPHARQRTPRRCRVVSRTIAENTSPATYPDRVPSARPSAIPSREKTSREKCHV